MLGAWLVFLAVVTASPDTGVGADVDRLLEQFLAADRAGRLKLADEIAAAHPDALVVEQRLRAGRRYSKDVPLGWRTLQSVCPDGKSRPYHLYVPESYNPAKKYPVRFALHGGVGRPDFLPEPIVTESRRRLGEIGAADNMIMVLPLGQRGATWYDDIGNGNLLNQLDYIKRHYNVDEDRVFVGGFSDGGTGAYWTALHRPTPWAGFASLSGSLIVAGGAPYQAYPRNLVNRPLHVTNGGMDRLYPAAIEVQFIRQIRALGAVVDWKRYPDAGHDLSYREEEDPRLQKFMRETRRPRRADIVWETAEALNGRCDWVQVDEIKDVGNNVGPEASNLLLEPPPAFALAGDSSFPGPGVRVQAVPKGSLAETAGIRPGDVIIQLEGMDILTARDGQRLYFQKLLAKRPGDWITGVYQRDGKDETFRVQAPKVPSEPVYKRDRPTAYLEAHAKGNRIDVRVRNVGRYRLFIDRKQFDLSKPIEVFTNGQNSFKGVVTPNLAFLLRQAAADQDRAVVYCTQIAITVPRQAGKSSP